MRMTMTDDTPSVALTWAQFHRVLTQLGYVRHQTERELIYEEPITGTLLLFPLFADTDIVERHHLYMARRNTSFKGVADEAQFDHILYQLLEPTPTLAAA